MRRSFLTIVIFSCFSISTLSTVDSLYIYAQIPIIGNGQRTNPFRAQIPPKIKIGYSALIPTNSNGKPIFSDAIVEIRRGYTELIALSPNGKWPYKLLTYIDARNLALARGGPIFPNLISNYYNSAFVPFAILATDNFNRTNANPLDGNWTTTTGIGALQLVSNAVGNASATDTESGARNTTTTFPNDQYSQAVLSTAGVVNDGGPAVRIASAATSYYFFTTNGINVEIWKNVTGSYTNVDSDIGAWITNDVLLLQAVGTTITSKINTVTFNSATDGSLTAGSPGFFIFDAALRFDNFEGGDFSAATGARDFLTIGAGR